MLSYREHIATLFAQWQSEAVAGGFIERALLELDLVIPRQPWHVTIQPFSQMMHSTLPNDNLDAHIALAKP